MNKNPQTIPLKKLSQLLTPEERKIVESEKKYYQLVVALRKKRQSLGMTQDDLARVSQVPRTTITKIESGSRNTTLETLMKLARALGSSVELRLA